MIKLGDKVVDRDGNKGVVVKVVEGFSAENHGSINVWQSERTEYGADNCEHYVFFGWDKHLTIIPNKTGMTDYEIVNLTGRDTSAMIGGAEALYYLTHDSSDKQSINNPQLGLTNLTLLRRMIESLLNYLPVIDKFNELQDIATIAGCPIKCDGGRFELNDSKFDTLDEVYRALKQPTLL